MDINALPADHRAQWRAGPSIGTNLLRKGYRQWAEGRAELSVAGIPANNLYRYRLDAK